MPTAKTVRLQDAETEVIQYPITIPDAVNGLSTVAKTGSYNDLTDKPTIPDAQVQSDWNASTGMGVILNKPTIPQHDYIYVPLGTYQTGTIIDIIGISLYSKYGASTIPAGRHCTIIIDTEFVSNTDYLACPAFNIYQTVNSNKNYYYYLLPVDEIAIFLPNEQSTLDIILNHPYLTPLSNNSKQLIAILTAVNSIELGNPTLLFESDRCYLEKEITYNNGLYHIFAQAELNSTSFITENNTPSAFERIKISKVASNIYIIE